jgi:hypothetical protein
MMRDGRMFHTLRKNVALSRIILVSSCGFWGIENFSELLHFIEGLTKTLNFEFSAVLRRPAGSIMKDKQDEQTAKDILEAASKLDTN